MARSISITSPYDKTDEILKNLENMDGIMQLQVIQNASVKPPGDVITVVTPNKHLQKLMRVLDGVGLGKKDGISILSSEPDSFIPTSSSFTVYRDDNESTWEEMEMIISNDSNTTINTLIIMTISGALATIGIATNSIHLVIGGMLVAPGFMPILRVSLGIVSRYERWHYGIWDTLKAYVTLILSAAVTAVILASLNYSPMVGATSYYIPDKELLEYWTTFTFPSVLASAVASVAGAILVATNKSVFTSGVMIGLALVPSAAIIGIGLVNEDFTLAGRAFLRFIVDIALVFVLPLLYLYWERSRSHKRDTSV
ncbi:DUF389 domain-containing protein [Pontibacter silvestris]|uniref:DUF389 domain-containing protein n=1 Tax=Pontibacter silvestris TaxID=2305183 RepID=A0ABW4WSM3_9BACT|nr:DUF389 domain-containing protein [Pontibacter silvestris]MCC9137739.1 DUF389 domain-containing protein [Pontibacter silvestris]